MKQTLLKKIISGILLLSLLSGLSLVSFAQDEAAPDTPTTEAAYDLLKGGTQTFEIVGDDGETDIITITECPGTTRVANGRYRIKYENKPYWSASFYVNVSNNNITSVSSPSCTAYTGRFTSSNLVLETSKKASYYLTYHVTVSGIQTGVRGYISGTTLYSKKI